MNERVLRLSQSAVRIIAIITLSILGIDLVCDRYYPSYSHALANSSLGNFLTLWTIAASLTLPFCVAFQAWWMRKYRVPSKLLWIDASLAIACFTVLLGIVLYAFGHYAMF